ncbi:M20/M25/M40 family metallo-hydrolase [Sphingomonas baiyangensis]|nr:M20/M25/M40 family metallo-hydrolase [Sphingomonas baiyangensis]
MLALTLPLALLASSQASDPLLTDLATLAAPRMEGRAPATRGSARARAHIIARLEAIGAAPLYARYERPFRTRHRGRALRGTNVLAQIDGTDRDDHRVIVVGAHYDHVGMQGGRLHPGADDNASGVAALLAIAQSLADKPARHKVILAFWDAEEPGFYGARAFVADPPVPLARIALNINLDMVSRSDKGELFAVGGKTYPQLQPVLDTLANEAPIKLRFGHEGPQEGDDDWVELSDHAAFHAKSIPFVYFGVEDHTDYHQPGDTAGKVPVEFFRGSAATILAAVRAFDAALDTAPGLAGPAPGR